MIIEEEDSKNPCMQYKYSENDEKAQSMYSRDASDMKECIQNYNQNPLLVCCYIIIFFSLFKLIVYHKFYCIDVNLRTQL